jgi:hypothetical protein
MMSWAEKKRQSVSFLEGDVMKSACRHGNPGALSRVCSLHSVLRAHFDVSLALDEKVV